MPLGTLDEWATEFPGPLRDATAVSQSAVLRISGGAAPALPPCPSHTVFHFFS